MYNYTEEKPQLFTEENQVKFLAIRDRINRVLRDAGAITMGSAISGALGSSWNSMACVDRLVEIGEIREIIQIKPAGQDRIFVKNQ